MALSATHKVRFLWADSASLCSEELTLAEEEQLLNLFKKKALRQAHFNEVRDAWFYRDASRPPHPAMGPQHVGDMCTVLSGFSCSVRVVATADGRRRGVFKADTAHKLVSRSHVHGVIARLLAAHGGQRGDAAFQSDVRRQLEGKHMMMRYSNQSLRIAAVDFSEDEASSFACGREQVRTSYRDYVRQRYRIKAELKECCVLRDWKGNAYLPQLAYLTLRSDECRACYDDILRVTNVPGVLRMLTRCTLSTQTLLFCAIKVPQRLARVDALVALINEAEEKATMDARAVSHMQLSLGLTIEPRCIETDALRLPYPRFTYAVGGARRGQTVPRTIDVGMLGTSAKWSGRDGTKGFLYDTRPIRKWLIVDDIGSGAADSVFALWQKYCVFRVPLTHSF